VSNLDLDDFDRIFWDEVYATEFDFVNVHKLIAEDADPERLTGDPLASPPSSARSRATSAFRSSRQAADDRVD
jgi:hypothetical protein